MTIYLAGPDVFAPDAGKRLAKKAEYVRKKVKGVSVLTPFDLDPPTLDSKKETAFVIRENNLSLIHQSDVILADLNPFRGAEPDSGTVYEVAYGTAFGKGVIGYMKDADKTQRERLGKKDVKGWEVENFKLPLNLMLHGENFIVCKDFEKAVKKLVKVYM